MSIAQALMAELEQEAAATRRILERIPADKLDWQPHQKSMTVGQLGLHIANTPGQVAELAREQEVEAPDFKGQPPTPATTAEVLSALDESVAKAKEVIAGLDDARMQETWSAILDGRPVLSMPRAALLRAIMLNHWYHHRGQLSVYLRLMGESVPAVYGPSADELPEFLRQTAEA